MKRFEANLRSKSLMVALAGVSALWLFVTVQTWVLERGLSDMAFAKIKDLDAHLDKQYQEEVEIDMVPRVTATREYLLFGVTRGKIHILLRTTLANGTTRFGAYDFFLEQEEGRWIEKESGFCGGNEIESDARAAFASFERH